MGKERFHQWCRSHPYLGPAAAGVLVGAFAGLVFGVIGHTPRGELLALIVLWTVAGFVATISGRVTRRRRERETSSRRGH